jgi:hypothetical protein
MQMGQCVCTLGALHFSFFTDSRVQQENNRKLKAFRQQLFGKYATSVPTIFWTPNNDFPKPSSSAKYHGSTSFVVPRAADLDLCPFIPGQKLYGVMIPRPENDWQKNGEESNKIMKKYQKLRSAKEKPMENKLRHDSIDVASMASEVGFEVMDLYDEELGYVKNVLTPPRDESTMNLGVEILQNSGKELGFEDAYQSVHDFSDVDCLEDDSNSRRLEKEKHGDAPNGRVRVANLLSQQWNELNESRNGVEITEVSEQEARFVKRSWRGLSFLGLDSRLPSVNFSSISTIKPEDMSMTQEMDTEEVAIQVTPAPTTGDDKGSAVSLDSKAKGVLTQVAPGDKICDNKSVAASLDSKNRHIEEMLSELSLQEKEGVDDVDLDSEVHGDGGAGGGDNMTFHDRLLARYQSPSFDSPRRTSMSPSSCDGTRPSEIDVTDAADDMWTLRSETRGSTLSEDIFDRIRIALSGTFTTSSTLKSSLSFENQKETSTRCEDDSIQSASMNHESTNIQISSAEDHGDDGFEIFETKK